MQSVSTILLALLLLTASVAARDGISVYESHYNSLNALQTESFNTEDGEPAASISTAYEGWFRTRLAPEILRHSENGDLGWIIKAAHLAAFHTHEPRYLKDLQQALEVLEHRRAATDQQRVLFYQTLVVYRRFDEARAYHDLHPSLDVEDIPIVVRHLLWTQGAAQAYAVDQEQRQLLPRSFQLSNGVSLVVISHPLCAFSRSAMETITGDPVLSTAVRDSAIWLAPVDMQLYFDKVQAWNRDQSTAQVVIARHRRDWPMVDDWSTPNFYLIQDGVTLDHFSGWPLDGSNRQRLIRMLDRGGLLSRTQQQ